MISVCCPATKDTHTPWRRSTRAHVPLGLTGADSKLWEWHTRGAASGPPGRAARAKPTSNYNPLSCKTSSHPCAPRAFQVRMCRTLTPFNHHAAHTLLHLQLHPCVNPQESAAANIRSLDGLITLMAKRKVGALHERCLLLALLAAVQPALLHPVPAWQKNYMLVAVYLRTGLRHAQFVRNPTGWQGRCRQEHGGAAGAVSHGAAARQAPQSAGAAAAAGAPPQMAHSCKAACMPCTTWKHLQRHV